MIKSFLLALSALMACPATATTELNRPISDEVFYFILTDRFDNGDSKNDRGGLEKPSNGDSLKDIMNHGFLPKDKGYYHGGDFKGITKNLDYIQGMGVTSLWLSPIQKNQPVQGDGTIKGSSAGYHGYWITDFTTVDPHLGTEEDFKKLVDEAHKRGMKVFIDVITNHTADIISYRGCGDCPYRSTSDYPYASKNKGFIDGDLSKSNFNRLKDPNFAYSPYVRDKPGKVKKPDWLNNIIYYHNRGNSTFSGENSLMGDFFGLDDLFTEHPRVVDGMIDIYKEWIRKYKIDGFRIDTVKHVNIEFWQSFVPEIRAYAKSQGIPHFFMFGEVFSAEPQILSRYTRDGKFDSVLDFAFQGLAKDVFADNEKLSKLRDTFAMDDVHRANSHPNYMLNFISNHDIGRLAHFIDESQKKGQFKLDPLKHVQLAHALMIFSRGVPVIYYGDEQGFIGDGGDKDARESMFPSKAKDYNDNKVLGSKLNAAAANFNSKHPIYEAIKEYTALYKKHPLLRRGEQHYYDSQQEGVFSFIRSNRKSGREYLVAFNLSGKEASITWQRKDLSNIYNGTIKGHKIKIPAQEFVILKARKPKAKKISQTKTKIISPEKNARVSKIFPFEVKIPGDSYHKVTFSYRNLVTKETTAVYTDYNRPYRAFIDTKGFADGSKLELVASIVGESGKRYQVSRKTTVDGRTPRIVVHYENGNKRKNVFHILSNGQSHLSQKLASKNSYTFTWPNGVEGAMLLFYDQEKKHQHFDLPVYLKFKEHIAKNLVAKESALEAHIYIDNNLRVRSKQGPALKGKPKTLPHKPHVSAPFGDEVIYIRGAMNTWQTSNPLGYLGNYSYGTIVELGTGLNEYKFSNKKWSAQLNFGAPITAEGLSKSGASANLKIQVPTGQSVK